MALKSIQYNQHTFDISYEIINPDAKVDIIILHGWGSNKTIMKNAFSPYMSAFRHIYIDLPGFGKSTCSVALKTPDVARIVELLMVHINASKSIVLGHSFGGKVATLLNPKVLILVASAGIYRTKSLKVQTKIALFKTLKVFGFAKLRSLFVADDAKSLSEPMYETFKNVVDEDFSHEFSSYDGKALLCWGKEDTATPLSSGEKINQLIKDSKLEVYDGDHFFFGKNSKDISEKVEKTFLQTLEH
ncbi:alpha/beta fold hydrolase [Sulfurimonas aquatica]|uniref:Alpha/beta fold hydrolase n=1 Tax=Sulfurimonas aquatica TaxID=2672570 RepID=A0A975B011_9BACT|nr:alpha/beta fold hydrolase [Sulfurimonas aquatica]QSZ41635.1 alpha/beta fold hydrolase [Sulfurimonas aquatica]